MFSLETRRILHDELMRFKIIHNLIDTTLSSAISYHHYQRPNRHTEDRQFYTKKTSSNFESHSPILRMQNNQDEFFRKCKITDSTMSLKCFSNLISDVFPYQFSLSVKLSMKRPETKRSLIVDWTVTVTIDCKIVDCALEDELM